MDLCERVIGLRGKEGDFAGENGSGEEFGKITTGNDLRLAIGDLRFEDKIETLLLCRKCCATTADTEEESGDADGDSYRPHP